MREWLLIHGWGYDARAWDSWVARLPPTDCVRRYDRGYFAPRQEPSFETRSERILVTHSMGWIWYDAWHMGAPDVWVLVASFDRFHERPAGRRVTDRMRRRLERGDARVLTEFYENAADPRPPTPGVQVGFDRLIDDLRALDDAAWDPACTQGIARLLLLAAGEDRIVGRQRTEALAALHPAAAWHVCPAVGHALPFVQPQWCLDRI